MTHPFHQPSPEKRLPVPGLAILATLATSPSAAPWIDAGEGAPTTTPAVGSIYLRMDGSSANEIVYIFDGSIWHAVPLEAGSDAIEDDGDNYGTDTIDGAFEELGDFKPRVIADPGDAGAIPADRSGVCPITTGGTGETRTLADADQVGLELTLVHDVDDGGAAVVTVASAFNENGDTTITLDDAGEAAHLRAVQVGGSPVWRAIALDGATAGS